MLDEYDSRTPITLEIYRLLPESLREEQTCIQCGEIFKECENIGRHLCRIHPGIRVVRHGRPEQEAFYTCCRQLVALRGRRHGCLLWDHHCHKFSETNAGVRLSQIQEAATVIVPHMLLRFITPPLRASIAYDTLKGGGGTQCRLFILRLPALGVVADLNNQLSSEYRPQIMYWDDADGDQESGACINAEIDDVSCKEFDLLEESRILWREGKNSPFFSRFSPQARESDRLIQGKCDLVWRSQLASGNAVLGLNQSENDGDAEDFQEVSFLIITRINHRLEDLSSRK